MQAWGRSIHSARYLTALNARQDTFQQNPQEGQEYKAALARTRQAVSVQKAIQLKNKRVTGAVSALTMLRNRSVAVAARSK